MTEPGDVEVEGRRVADARLRLEHHQGSDSEEERNGELRDHDEPVAVGVEDALDEHRIELLGVQDDAGVTGRATTEH